jgi:hypothetical protein
VVLKKDGRLFRRTWTGTARRNDSTTNSDEMQILPAEVCKQTLDDWRDSAAEYVRAQLFDKKQFITDEEIGMGGIHHT